MFNPAKELAKNIARIIFGEYSIYYIYASPDNSHNTSQIELKSGHSVQVVDLDTVKSSADPLIRDQVNYLGSEALAYACYVEDRIAGLCIYWFGERYQKRNFWPLKEGEAKLVQIVTVPQLRGGGIAMELITRSNMDMLKKGFSRMYARIWHSNAPSLRAFQRAGWTRRALLIEMNPLRLGKPIRLRHDLKS